MKTILFFLLFISFGSGTIFAGEEPKKVISGKVSDKVSHESLAGVKVSVEGTSIVTYTDINGSFTIFVPEKSDAKITFSFISYLDSSLPINTVLSKKEFLLSSAE
ncbi:MAG TPA: carboxypeptidase-like regulatory domain-containing protein [Nitrosopumilaceae archaeon]|jgi:hypothetical protein|nr:carboxypeptidase-like regulatory domain-containing protein [Nitrosopumilaceae archaeon]